MAIPPVITLALMLVNGGLPSATSSVYNKESYYGQLIATIIVISYIPLSLRLIHPLRLSKKRYKKLARARIITNCILSSALILLYFLCMPLSSFMYLALIVWLANFFCQST